MRAFLQALVALIVIVLILAGAGVAYVSNRGLSARAEPGPVEAFLATRLRNLAIPRSVRDLQNPVPRTAAALAEGRTHYADHCASCHGVDGSGNTEMGQGLWPKAPDMRQPTTQSLTDGELFYIIENGVRFTGMPGWSTGTKEGEEATWRLVHFIRHLPAITEEEIAEMEAMTPRTLEQWRQQAEIEAFLSGADVSSDGAASKDEAAGADDAPAPDAVPPDEAPAPDPPESAEPDPPPSADPPPASAQPPHQH